MEKATSSYFFISALVIAGIALGNAGSTLYFPAMPAIATSLHTDGSMMKLSLSLFLIGFGVSQLFYGPLSDAFGRKINLLAGLSIFILSSFICALSQDVFLFLAGRLIEGLGIGAVNAVGYALMRDLYSGPALTLQFSYMSVFVGAMPLIAPIIGGYLVFAMGWQACFYFLAFLALTLVVLKKRYLPETVAVLDASACHPRVVFKKYGMLLTSPVYMGYAMVAGVALGCIFTMGSTLPFLLVNELGISPSVYGWIAGIPALGYLSGSFLSGRLAASITLPKLIVFGAFLGLLSLIVGLLVNAVLATFTIYSLIIPLIFFMLGIGFLVPTASSGAMAPFPELAGSESALLCAFMFSFASLLTAIGSRLHITTPTSLFYLLGVALLFALAFLSLAHFGEKK